MKPRHCDVAVVGLGLMGSAALHALARRGVDAIGFDPLIVGEARGSSHGSCRIWRRFNFESPAYTALSDEAFAGWRALEAASGRTLLRPCPLLEAGPPGSAIVRQSREVARAAAQAAGVVGGPTTGAEVNAAWPAFRLPQDWDAVVQESAGILLAQTALQALRDGVADRIVPLAARIEATPAGVRVVTADEDILAGQAIVAAGPWLGAVVPALAPLLRVTRQTVGWFRPSRPAAVALGDFPIFLLEGPRAVIYGFPDFEGRGVKVGQHDHGPTVSPDDWTSAPTDAELEPVRASLAAFIPAAAGPIVEREMCLYTNTLAADVRPDGGEEFIIDRLPSDPRIIVASPCSGHGAKFAPAIGEILASLALDPAFEADRAFRLDRFSAFAR
ncbi:MAG TPA: N-methyl-L-tryptophan oxidase [Caulobacteraceae bacterium]|nr:N-methyl-L-tryptophan oxidase [Caulobacteraceae bacterium]